MAKLNPNYQNFLTNAAAAGFSTHEVISYITDLFGSPGSKQTKKDLSAESARPDEKAAAQTLHRSEMPERLIKGAAGAVGRVGGIAAVPGLIGKGISALQGIGNQSSQQQQASQAASPNTGGAGQGTSGRLSPQSQQNPPGYNPAASLLRQFPDLGKFMQDQIAKGLDVQSAVSLARNKKLLAPIIKRIENEMGEDFGAFASRLFGDSQQQGSSQFGAVQGKSQFLDGLNQLAGMIQSLKGK